MFNYQETLQAMRSQQASMQQEMDRLDRAISALQAVVSSPAPAKSAPKSSVQSGRDVSRRGSRPVKAKPAKRSIQQKAQQPKREISAQGLRNIIEAQKKRWANARSAAKANAKQSAQTKAKSAVTPKASRPVTGQ
jgi:hypothetical protein